MKTGTIQYNSPDYHQMLKLRYEVLRKPLGLVFTEEDLTKEANDIFCICKIKSEIIGCCVLTPINESDIKLRQMAVNEEYRKSGIGKTVLFFAEETVRKNGYKRIILNARLVAKGFYLAFDYKIIGDIFTEVGIPHIKMQKDI